MPFWFCMVIHSFLPFFPPCCLWDIFSSSYHKSTSTFILSICKLSWLYDLRIQPLVWFYPTQNYAVCWGGTSRENLFRGRYRVGKLGLRTRYGQGFLIQIGKTCFSFVWGNMMIWAKCLIEQQFLELAYHKAFVLIRKMAQCKLESTAYTDSRTLTLNGIRYLRLGLLHLVTPTKVANVAKVAI